VINIYILFKLDDKPLAPSIHSGGKNTMLKVIGMDIYKLNKMCPIKLFGKLSGIVFLSAKVHNNGLLSILK